MHEVIATVALQFWASNIQLSTWWSI